jgi:predicted SnoaL-like aldol condensation-catalyzing enzyme
LKPTALCLAIATITLAACQKAPETNDVLADASTTSATTAVIAPRASLAPQSPAGIAGQPVAVIAHPDPLSVLHNNDPALASNKRLVFDMWRTVLNAGHLEVADAVFAEDYMQYSPFQRSGREAMKQMFAVIPRQDLIPDVMRPPPVTFVAEDDLVMLVAVEMLPEPDGSGSYTTTHFNMFRVEDGRLAAHWHTDTNPPCPGMPAAGEGGPYPVTGATGQDQYALLQAATPELAKNKRLVFDMWRQVVDAGREELADLYLAENIIEHNPNIATGREAFKAYIASYADQPIATSLRAPLVAMLAEDDLVVQVLKVELPDPFRPGQIYTTTRIDMFRIADGRIAEHWDASAKPGTEVEEMGAACTSP